MLIKKPKKLFFLIPLLIFSLFLTMVRPILAVGDYDTEIENIQKQIEEKEKRIKELQTQKEIYQEKIQIKRNEAVSLKNQISILRSQITQRQIEVEAKGSEIEIMNLSIQNIQFRILEKKKEINDFKEKLKIFLQIINSYDRKNFLEIIFFNDSISGVLNHLRYLNSFQSELARSLEKISLIKEGMEIQETDLRNSLQELIELESDLRNKKAKLNAENQTVQIILNETRGAEWKFQALLAEVVTEWQINENEIIKLEREARIKIAQEKEQKAELLEAEGIIVFSWPVPNEGITAKFRDPDYPYRKWIGEHSAIDIRAGQGTAIRAAASGYVARAKHGGLGYSYVMLIHNDEFSTVYGHVNKILVEEGEYVKRGTIIARSGGLPGTSGAGRFSTGPHLHFEVRLNGIPVNPEDYLL